MQVEILALAQAVSSFLSFLSAFMAHLQRHKIYWVDVIEIALSLSQRIEKRGALFFVSEYISFDGCAEPSALFISFSSLLLA